MTSAVVDSALFFQVLWFSAKEWVTDTSEYTMWTDVLFEPTGTRGSLRSVREKLVTGAVFACALALACLFVFYFITA